MMGDLNCHSKSQFCRSENRQGRILNDLIGKPNFHIINNSTPTHNGNAKSSDSVIDLMFISNDLYLKLNYFSVKNDDLMSDHQHIMANFNIELKNSNYTGDIIKIKKTNWELYSQEIISNFKSINTLYDEELIYLRQIT